MSKPYQAVCESLTIKDATTRGLSLLGLLPPGEMHDLLTVELEKEGWARQPDGSLVKRLGEATATLSPDGTSVSLSGERETGTIVGRHYDAHDELTEEEGEAAARADAVRAAEQAQQKTGAELAQVLSRADADLGAALEGVLGRVYVEALKRKAGRMGDILEIAEVPGEGVRITVEIA